MSYPICLHPTEEAHQSWSMCWSRQWPWSWWPSPGGLRHSETVRPHPLTNHSDTRCIRTWKMDKNKAPGLIYSVLTLAWYNSDSIFLFFLMTCLICLLCWRVGFLTFPTLLNNHPAFITDLPTFSKVPTTVANALTPQGTVRPVGLIHQHENLYGCVRK